MTRNVMLEEQLKRLSVGVRGGGNLVSHRPLFSHDSKSLYVVCSNTVKVYSTESGFCTGQVRTPSAAPIANISLVPATPTSTTDILVILTTTGVLLHVSIDSLEFLRVENVTTNWPKEWVPITTWLNVICTRPDVFLMVGHPENVEETMLYLVTRLDRKNHPAFNFEKLCWKILNNSHSVASGVKGELVAALQGDSVFMCNTVTKVTKWHLSGTRKFTCVAAHPRDWVVATGDDSGRIVVWNNFLEDKSPAKSVFHWHTLPVADLVFSAAGSRIFSGGGECTLVKWDLQDTVNKRTVPRLGLPIRHVNSYADVLCAVSHADNSIQILDSSNKVVASIQNITQCYIPESAEDANSSATSLGGSAVFQAGLHLDPNNKNLVMNGKPGHLQCYSTRADRHLYMMDITQQNYITAERKKLIPNSDVTHVAFSKQGRWLATVESLHEESTCIELRLKFWKFDQSKQLFSLNTSINWPHENGVLSLKFQPIDDDDLTLVAATSGKDQSFRTWGVVYDQSIHGKSDWWNCENAGTYKALPAGPIAFSQDGSVLSAAFGNTLTLWTTENHKLDAALCHSKLQGDIKLLEFASHPTSHLVICCSEEYLAVWDVITLSLMWAVPFHAESLAVDGLSNLVAAFSTKRHLYFFRPDQPEPLAVHNNVSRSTVVASIFVPNPTSYDLAGLKSRLLFINSSQELCELLAESEDSKLESVTAMKIKKDVSTLTPFAQLIAEKTVSQVDNSTDNLKLTSGHIGYAGTQIIRDIMDSSPMTMPSVTFFCGQLVSALSTRKTSRTNLEEVEKAVMRSFDFNRKPDSDTEDDEDDSLLKPRRASQPSSEAVPPAELQSEAEPKLEFMVDLDYTANDDSWIHGVFAQRKT